MDGGICLQYAYRLLVWFMLSALFRVSVHCNWASCDSNKFWLGHEMIVSAVGSADCLDANYDDNVCLRKNISHTNISNRDAVCNKHNTILPFLWEWNKYLIWCWVWVSRCQSWVMTQGLGGGGEVWGKHLALRQTPFIGCLYQSQLRTISISITLGEWRRQRVEHTTTFCRTMSQSPRVSSLKEPPT